MMGAIVFVKFVFYISKISLFSKLISEKQFKLYQALSEIVLVINTNYFENQYWMEIKSLVFRCSGCTNNKLLHSDELLM